MNDRPDSDDDIRSALLATGDAPSEHFAAALQATLTDAAGGRAALRVAPRTNEVQRRSPWPFVLAAAAAIALVVAGIAIVGRDDQGLTVPGDEVSTTSTAIATDITDRWWIGDQRDGAVVPMLRFSGDTLQYTDPCGDYVGEWDPNAMIITAVGANATDGDCAPEGTGGALTGATLSPGADVLALSFGGSEIATFRALDVLPPATEDQVLGQWDLDGLTIGFEPGTMVLETCSDNWSITDHLVTYSTLADSTCFGGFRTRHGERLRSMLGSPDLTAFRNGDELYLVDDAVALRLTPAGARDAAAELLAGKRWIIDTVQGRRYPLGLAAYLEVTPQVQPIIQGYDGCNWYGATGSVALTAGGLRLEISGVESTAVDCAADRAVGPVDGDIVVTSLGADEMTWTNPAGAERSFVNLDSLPAATAAELPGRWVLEGSGLSHIDLTPDDGSGAGTLGIGTCAVGWKLDTRLTTDGWPDDPYSCLDGSADDGSSRLIEALLAGVEVRREPTSQALILSNTSFVFRLGAGETALDPSGIVLATGSAYGYRPGEVVSVDDARDQLATTLGPPTHDTGWFTTETTTSQDGDCMGGRVTRTLWWDDLSMSFWRINGESGPEELLWTWTVGDTHASRLEDRREAYLPPPEARSGLTTEADIPIGVGSTEQDLIDAYGSRLERLGGPALDDGTAAWSAVGVIGWELHGNPVLVLTRDGVVTGFGSAIPFC